jgi:hypothetical protein
MIVVVRQSNDPASQAGAMQLADSALQRMGVAQRCSS